MTGPREVRGIISWASIGARLSCGVSGEYVRELMEKNVEVIADNESIFAVIPIILEKEYCLIRSSADNIISGIATASDLGEQFQKMSEAFLRVAKIEKHLRQIIASRFSIDELKEYVASSDGGRVGKDVTGVRDLTFGHYERIFQNEQSWNRFNWKIDRNVFCTQLGHIRSIRNSIVHDDPEGLNESEKKIVTQFSTLLHRLHVLGMA